MIISLSELFANTRQESDEEPTVDQVLNQLGSDDRDILTLRYLLNHKPTQVAQILAITPEALYMRLSRARVRFKRTWTKIIQRARSERSGVHG